MDQIAKFFAEMLLRLFGKTPLFFKIMTIIGAVASLIGFIPEIVTYLGIELSDKWTMTLKVAGLVTMVVSQMTNAGNPVAVTDDGHVLESPNEKKLPFSSAVTSKKAAKKEVPVVKLVG